jgi:hypothetical protein
MASSSRILRRGSNAAAAGGGEALTSFSKGFPFNQFD